MHAHDTKNHKIKSVVYLFYRYLFKVVFGKDLGRNIVKLRSRCFYAGLRILNSAGRYKATDNVIHGTQLRDDLIATYPYFRRIGFWIIRLRLLSLKLLST